MDNFDQKVSNLVVQLFNIEAVKFGDFIVKSGLSSPVYFDLRVIVSHPTIMETVCDLLTELAPQAFICDQLCGVPYTALPIATILSIKTKKPMLIRRKEAKAYGTKKLIEGQFKLNQRCVIIEDVVTSGSSILETEADLRKEGLLVDQAVIILDREQGGLENLRKRGIEVAALITMSRLLNILLKAGLITAAVSEQVKEYLKSSQTTVAPRVNKDDRAALTYGKRIQHAENAVAKRLFKLMEDKKTNLCVAADVKTTTEILSLLEKTGPYICLLKLHIDMVEDFNNEFIAKLTSLAAKQNVLLMEDRKYGDIGNTVALQFSVGVHKVSSWADLVTVHSVPGSGGIKGIRSVLGEKPLGIFLVAEMSSEGNLITPQYTEATMDMAKQEANLVAGIVCQKRGVVKSPGLIQLTPGVQLQKSTDTLGQNYLRPRDIIVDNDADIAVVGRGIIKARNPEIAAKEYRDVLWECYESRLIQDSKR